MCLLAMALNVNPKYKLIICSNRDEFLNRPTQPAHDWGRDSRIFAGKDLLKGGTWMGVNRKGKIAAVTNVREIQKTRFEEVVRSRGELVSSFLETSVSTVEYSRYLKNSKEQFEGYNLIFGEGNHWYYASNRTNTLELKQGIHAVSNADIHTEWPKTAQVKEKLQGISQSLVLEKDLIEKCMIMLRDEEVYNDNELPDTGVDIETERLLSPIFIKGQTYGTRASTVILIGNDGKVKFVEQSYGPNGIRKESVEKSWYL